MNCCSADTWANSVDIDNDWSDFSCHNREDAIVDVCGRTARDCGNLLNIGLYGKQIRLKKINNILPAVMEVGKQPEDGG